MVHTKQAPRTADAPPRHPSNPCLLDMFSPSLLLVLPAAPTHTLWPVASAPSCPQPHNTITFRTSLLLLFQPLCAPELPRAPPRPSPQCARSCACPQGPRRARAAAHAAPPAPAWMGACVLSECIEGRRYSASNAQVSGQPPIWLGSTVAVPVFYNNCVFFALTLRSPVAGRPVSGASVVTPLCGYHHTRTCAWNLFLLRMTLTARRLLVLKSCTLTTCSAGRKEHSLDLMQVKKVLMIEV